MTVTVIEHPLIQHKLTLLRDKNTSTKEFREITNEIASLLCYEATRDLPLTDTSIETPVAQTVSKRVSSIPLIVPILRAGLGMVDGVLKLIPTATVVHLGLYRDAETHQPVSYYSNLSSDIAGRDVIILDPMLATGGTAVDAIQHIKDCGVRSIKLLCILAAQPGIENVQDSHPDVNIFTCCIDPELNSHAYIVPGLGDAGDRIFGTE
jgi:uracil phosphoribosyltransferase